MAWLWDSWEEYYDFVQPVTANNRKLFRIARRDTWFKIERCLWEAVERLTNTVISLYELGFTGKNHRPPHHDQSVIKDAKPLVIEGISTGEELLLYHKRLAENQAAHGFLSSHDLLDHWENYEASGRLPKEINQLMDDIWDLLKGYQDLVESDEQFLVDNLNLPPELENDFRMARDLFSVGFEEMGLFVAGRGLESVLRKIADSRKIKFENKGKLVSIEDISFNDLIETIWQVHWKSKRTRLITKDQKGLLDYLRIVRNQGAHDIIQRKWQSAEPRHMAVVIAKTADKLWNEIAMSRARIDPMTVKKSW